METVKFKRFEKDVVWFETSNRRMEFPVPVFMVDQIELEKETELSKFEFYLDRYLFKIKESFKK